MLMHAICVYSVSPAWIPGMLLAGTFDMVHNTYIALRQNQEL